MDIGRDYNGHDGARQLMETLTEGMETEIVITQLYTFSGRRFRDGLILRIDGFRSRAEALEAAGLAEYRNSVESYRSPAPRRPGPGRSRSSAPSTRFVIGRTVPGAGKL